MAESFLRHEEDDSSDSDVPGTDHVNFERPSQKIKGEEMWDMDSDEKDFDGNSSSDEESMDRKLFEEIPHVSSQGTQLENKTYISHLIDRHGKRLHRPSERQINSTRSSPEKSITRERSSIDSAGNITLMTETVYKCNKCDKTFFTRSGYRKHQRNHTEENNYICNDCGKTFTDWTSYNIHKETHTGGRPWSCAACDKRFRLQSHLARHERTHTGERPYMCNVCGKGFGQSSNLATHMRTHTGEKPYACNECGSKEIWGEDEIQNSLSDWNR
ncbi:hypothetical protein FKM82_011432 [Ascaphus truei]